MSFSLVVRLINQTKDRSFSILAVLLFLKLRFQLGHCYWRTSI